MARGVDQLSRRTRAQLQWPAGSTICARILWLGHEGQRCRLTLPGDSDSCPSTREVDHLSRASRARVQGPVGSTSCPRRLRPCSEGPRGRPALPGHSHPAPISRGVDELWRVTRAPVQWPARSTGSPGQLAIRSEGPRVDQFPQATRAWAECSQDRQISWATHARVRGPVVSTSTPW